MVSGAVPAVTITIEAFDPKSASRDLWVRFHAFRRQRATENEPDEPVTADADVEYDAKRDRPLQINYVLLAWSDGEIIGSLGMGVRRPGTADYAEHRAFVYIWGGVLTASRRHGVGTALLAGLAQFMDEQGKTIATCNARLPAGHGFLRAIGAVAKYRSVENRLAFAALDWDMLTQWHADGKRPGSGLAWEVHFGRVPMDRLAALMAPLTALAADVPLGALDLPPVRFELRGYQAWYTEMDRHGGAHLLVLLRDGDAIAGICEASWDKRFPDRVFQQLTAVARAWRGAGLAKGLKAAMLLLVRERLPTVHMMITSNAEVNAPMLSINARLGFAVHRRDAMYQIERDVLAAWLARR